MYISVRKLLLIFAFHGAVIRSESANVEVYDYASIPDFFPHK